MGKEKLSRWQVFLIMPLIPTFRNWFVLEKRVAICDQLEDPKMTKKLVKRGITELVTPGVSINDNVLNYKEK